MKKENEKDEEIEILFKIGRMNIFIHKHAFYFMPTLNNKHLKQF